jgi:UDP-N-acetylmuramate--alanine ligase
MDTYQGDFNKLKGTFVEFLHHLPFYGLAVLCIDDPTLKSLLPEVKCPVLTYGQDPEADFQLTNLSQQAGQSHFTVIDNQAGISSDITLNMPGLHNALNATAAIAVARNLDVSIHACQQALQKFAGVGRRFNVLGDLETPQGQIMLVDDYGHHPTELAATIAAAKAGWPDKRLVVVFQPHRYSRTRDLFEDFSQVLSTVDVLIMLEVYAAGEDKIAGADARSLCRSIRMRGQVDPVFVESKQDLFAVLPSVLQQGDLLLTMGAGNVGGIAVELPAVLMGEAEA